MKRLLIATAMLVGLCSGLYAASNALSNLSSGTTVTGSDLFYDVQTPGTGGVKVTGSQIKSFISSNPTFSGTVTLPDLSTWGTAGLASPTLTLGGSSSTLTLGGSGAVLTGTTNVSNLTGANITFSGQLISAGGKPSVFACGTSPTGAVSSTSTNQSGSLQTGGGSLTSCGIGFSAVQPTTPRTCTLVAESSAAASDLTQTFVSALTAGGWTITAVNTLSTATFGYICL